MANVVLEVFSVCVYWDKRENRKRWVELSLKRYERKQNKTKHKQTKRKQKLPRLSITFFCADVLRSDEFRLLLFEERISCSLSLSFSIHSIEQSGRLVIIGLYVRFSGQPNNNNKKEQTIAIFVQHSSSYFAYIHFSCALYGKLRYSWKTIVTRKLCVRFQGTREKTKLKRMDWVKLIKQTNARHKMKVSE